MKSIALVLLVVVGSALGLDVAAAFQSVAAIHKTTVALLAIQREMLTGQKNLRQMKGVLSSVEKDSIDTVVSEAEFIQQAVSGTVDIGQLIRELRHDDDADIARGYLRDSAQHSIEEIDNDLELVNACLTAFTTPAALAEATKIRDKMIEAREDLRRLASKDDN